MLTRAQVAERLGKSIATVRRMEGTELHPRRDAAGIHRFSPAEVDAVARVPRKRFVMAPDAERHEATERECELERLLAESENTVHRLEHQLSNASAARPDANCRDEEVAHLHQALELAFSCIIEQLGPRTPPETVKLLERLIARYSTARAGAVP